MMHTGWSALEALRVGNGFEYHLDSYVVVSYKIILVIMLSVYPGPRFGRTLL